MKKTYFYVAAFLSFYVCEALFAVAINNQDINTLIKPGQALIYEIPGADNIFVRLKNGNITLGTLKLTNVSAVQNFFNELNNYKNELYQNVSKGVLGFKSSKQIAVKGAYISGDEGILLYACTDIEVDAAILTSKEKIVFHANQLNIDGGCFVDTPLLYIESNLLTSLCQIIRFTFNKTLQFSAVAQGHIDFENNEIDILMVGASKVEIVFAPQAFENHQKAADNVNKENV